MRRRLIGAVLVMAAIPVAANHAADRAGAPIGIGGAT